LCDGSGCDYPDFWRCKMTNVETEFEEDSFEDEFEPEEEMEQYK